MAMTAARAAGVAMMLALGACAGTQDYAMPRQTTTAATPLERYCYRTLAGVDCFAAPQPGEERRRVGYFDAPGPH